MCITGRSHRRSPILVSGILPVTGSAIEGTKIVSSNAVTEAFNNPELIGTDEVERQPKRRRRAPQKPGLTAKGEIRHFVQHQYKDHSNDQENSCIVPSEEVCDSASTSSNLPFPIKLYQMLMDVETLGISHIISWLPHGRAFLIHKPKTFVEYVLPKYFSQSKLTSFQRQLNLYGFTRLTRVPDNGGYYHECFLRGKVFLARSISRTKVKGTKFKATSSPESEPNFYCMPYVSPVCSNVTHIPALATRYESKQPSEGVLVSVNSQRCLYQGYTRITSMNDNRDQVQTLFASLPEGAETYLQELAYSTPRPEAIFDVTSDECSNSSSSSNSTSAGHSHESSLQSHSCCHIVMPQQFRNHHETDQDMLVVSNATWNFDSAVAQVSAGLHVYDDTVLSVADMGLFSEDIIDDLIDALAMDTADAIPSCQ